MLILGIDPGTATTGYGLLKINGKAIYEVLDFGLIETEKNGEQGKRLINIHKQISKIISDFKPDVVAIERLFFATNAKTAIAVGQAQGVMLFAVAQANKEIFEYSPMTIKKQVTGNGRADKKLVQTHLRKVLGNKIRSKKHKKTHFDNAADALAVALCHVYQSKQSGDISKK
jgi:crossover junction endodeoxyribonuclease RuvC